MSVPHDFCQAKENRMYQKPELVKHDDLKQVTFSSH